MSGVFVGRLGRRRALFVSRSLVCGLLREPLLESFARRAFAVRKSNPLLAKAYGGARLFDVGRNNANTGAFNFTGDVQKGLLLDVSTPGTFVKAVTNATNANPVVYSSTLNPTNNDIIVVGAVGGNLSANQTGLATASGGASFSLLTLNGGFNVQGSAAYTSGGYAVNLTQAAFVTDILGVRVSTDQVLAGKTSSRGVANCTAPISWPTIPVGNTVTAVIFFDEGGGTDATRKLMEWQDGRVVVIVDKAVIATDTSIVIEPLRGKLWDGTTGSAPVLSWSDGHSSTLNAAANQGDRSLTVTSQAAGGVANGSQAEGVVFGGGMPFTTSGASFNFTPTAIYAPTLPTGLWQV